MNIKDIHINDIVINTTRHIRASSVEIQFKYNDIVFKAAMRCRRSLKSESETQEKILKYLGFTDAQIQELGYV